MKRASKIKSKAYRKSHKKEKALRAEMEQQIASLDKQTAQKLQLRREMERVRKRNVRRGFEEVEICMVRSRTSTRGTVSSMGGRS